MSFDELTPTDIGLTTAPDGNGGTVDISMLNYTPLWFYILREADIRENGSGSDLLVPALSLRYSSACSKVIANPISGSFRGGTYLRDQR